jgi:hypothetical protein
MSGRRTNKKDPMTNQQVLAVFTKNASPEFRKIVEKLVEVLENSSEQIDAALKWKQLTYAYRSDFHHWICGINITKQAVGLSFHFGGLLDDPKGVFKAGSSAFLRKIEYRKVEDIDEATVLDFLSQALKRLEYFKTNWKEIQRSQAG